MDPKDNNNPNTDNVTPPTSDTGSAAPAADTTNEQAAGAIDLNDLSNMPNSDSTAADATADATSDAASDATMGSQSEPADSTASAPSIDDNPNITVESSKEPPQDLDGPKPLDVEPAAPTLGSIGSATSGPVKDDKDTKITDDSASTVPAASTDAAKPDNVDVDNLLAEAAATSPASPEQPASAAVAPANKSHRSATILSIVLVVLLTIACVVLAIMLVQTNEKANKNSQSQQAPTSSTSSIATLVCTADVTSKQPESLQPLKKAQNTRSFTYKDQTFSELTDITQYTFDDASVATTKLESLKASYKDAYTAVSMTQDPFTSEFSMNDAVVKASHMITADNFDAKSAALIGLNVGSDGKVNTEQSTMKKSLEAEGYICASGETSTTESK